MATPLHHAEWVLIRHILFRVCAISTSCSVIANVLPNEARFEHSPMRRFFYELIIFFVAALSFNWRACLPGLDGEWMGFSRACKCCSNEPIAHLKQIIRLRRRQHHRRKDY